MKNVKITMSLFLTMTILNSACSDVKNKADGQYVYKPDDQKLYDQVVHLDSVFFAAYNSCDVNLDKYASFYADSLEFYHDKGGFTNSKQEVVDGTKKNVCGKVTRELVKGSIEVYPINNYGAIEMGLHKFHNKEDPGAQPHASKFIIIWQHKNNEWKITRVVSLH